MVTDQENFLHKVTEKLKPYLVKFKKDETMKKKTYIFDCAMGGDQRCLVIMITHNECTFSANNGVRQV